VELPDGACTLTVLAADELTAELPGGLKSVDYVAIVGYLVLTFGIAVWFSRRQKSTEDFFVGGRRMPFIAVGLSILATLFSTISYLGVPGEMIKRGIGMFLGQLSLPFSALVIAAVWIPFFMKLRLTSAYEYLEKRFSPPARFIAGGLFTLLRLGWMSMVVYAASTALIQIKGGDWEWLPGNDMFWCVGMIGIVAAIYTAMGGMEALIWVDVLQCLLLLAGVLLAIGFVIIKDQTGPFDWWHVAANYQKSHTELEWFSWDVTVRFTVVTALVNTFFWTICTHGSDQVVLQRYFTTGSVQAARRSYYINMVVDITMATLMATAGLALLAYYLKHAHELPSGATADGMADKLFPYFLGHALPSGCAGLIVSAFLCDAIQTLESGANAIAAVVSQDLLPQKKNADSAERTQNLWRARGLTFLITVIVTCFAYVVSYIQQAHDLSIVDMMPKFFNLFVGPLAGMFFVGMFLPRCSTAAVVPAVLLGVTVSILWSWWEVLVDPSVKLTIALSTAVPYSVTVVTAFLIGLVAPEQDREKAARYSWWNITRSPETVVGGE
jgi:solute:Na+ symporter, SSS family